MNPGYLYNKRYFQYVSFNLHGKAKMESNRAMETLLKFKSLPKDENKKLSGDVAHFPLTTTYPGLLCGGGYQHEIGGRDMESEFKLGFFFDHTTGLPVIPGSSIKGVLRYACEMREGKYLNEIIKGLATENKKDNDYRECDTRLKKEAQTVHKIDAKEFLNIVFEGKKENKDKEDNKSKEGISIYKRDIFLDAFPVEVKNTLFGNDYITHHEHPLKNPNPVQFLRVQPQVTYQFQFILYDSNGISAALKLEIFRQIILDLGLGAKTNVGYGQFQ